MGIISGFFYLHTGADCIQFAALGEPYSQPYSLSSVSATPGNQAYLDSGGYQFNHQPADLSL